MGDGHTKILILGAGGQIGLELTETLRAQHSTTDVIASDIRQVDQLAGKGPFELLDVLDREAVYDVVRRHGITEIYHLAAVLSATGEKNPAFAWKLNMDGLLHVLDACRDLGVKKLFWPSSIAVFGPDTPRHNTPQSTVMNPNTVYGISKQAGELWCAYYHAKFGVDVRSIRYPGLIGYKSLPGGGTTDYAVDIYHQALAKGSFDCFLNADTALPMMYMPDAIRATLELMAAPAATTSVVSALRPARSPPPSKSISPTSRAPTRPTPCAKTSPTPGLPALTTARPPLTGTGTPPTTSMP
jgi:nucleoside-diphosphate-sugar epimerase